MNNFLQFLCRRILLVFVVVCVVSAPAYGHSMEGHEKDWVRCLGIDVEATRKAGGERKLEELWNKAQEIIDKIDPDYAEIKERFPWFSSWDNYGHRLFFHWGFDTYPDRHLPLAQTASENFDRYLVALPQKRNFTNSEREFLRRYPDGKISKNDEMKRFFRQLKEMQDNRNRRLISKVWETMGLGSQDRGILANILYDIHMLGDHVSWKNLYVLSAVINERALGQDILKCARKLMGYDKSTYGVFEQEIRDVRTIRYVEGRAMKTLDILAKYLPSVLSQKYGKQLERKGIYLVRQEENKSQEGSK